MMRFLSAADTLNAERNTWNKRPSQQQDCDVNDNVQPTGTPRCDGFLAPEQNQAVSHARKRQKTTRVVNNINRYSTHFSFPKNEGNWNELPTSSADGNCTVPYWDHEVEAFSPPPSSAYPSFLSSSLQQQQANLAHYKQPNANNGSFQSSSAPLVTCDEMEFEGDDDDGASSTTIHTTIPGIEYGVPASSNQIVLKSDLEEAERKVLCQLALSGGKPMMIHPVDRKVQDWIRRDLWWQWLSQGSKKNDDKALFSFSNPPAQNIERLTETDDEEEEENIETSDGMAMNRMNVDSLGRVQNRSRTIEDETSMDIDMPF